jgi:HTH-type transcriptional regulator/antitoxin HigA
MIKNEKQYKIAKKKLRVIYNDIDRLLSGREHLPAKDELILVSLRLFQEQLENEIDAYDLLKELNSPILRERSIDELPELLIEFKILSGLTQKGFSQKIGMKEQQLQRYEAENFNSISFKNLLKILHAAGLEVTVKGAVSSGKKSAA